MLNGITDDVADLYAAGSSPISCRRFLPNEATKSPFYAWPRSCSAPMSRNTGAFVAMRNVLIFQSFFGFNYDNCIFPFILIHESEQMNNPPSASVWASSSTPSGSSIAAQASASPTAWVASPKPTRARTLLRSSSPLHPAPAASRSPSSAASSGAHASAGASGASLNHTHGGGETTPNSTPTTVVLAGDNSSPVLDSGSHLLDVGTYREIATFQRLVKVDHRLHPLSLSLSLLPPPPLFAS